MQPRQIATIAVAAVLSIGSTVASAQVSYRERERPVVKPWWSHRIIGPGSDYFYGRHPYPWYGAISGIYTGDPGACYVPRLYPTWGGWNRRLQFVC